VPAIATRFVSKLMTLSDPYVHLSYSQDGEDMVLRRLLGSEKRNGFYVDVGAHHPFRFSNTCYFYRLGWRGINIDADPDAVALFAKARSRDINICMGVGAVDGELTFHRFSEPALNTFDPALGKERLRISGVHMLEERKVRVRLLADILDEVMPEGTSIDFLSIDVEGLDEDVIASNDWRRYRPRFVLVEVLRVPFNELAHCAGVKALRSVGYELVAKTSNTAILELAQ
jgi:FkbM family methyltransferase